jgi:serine/threonine-protein kinase
MDLAQVHVLLGNEDQAIRLLEQVSPLPTILTPDHPLQIDPVWDPLRDLPRFQVLVGNDPG